MDIRGTGVHPKWYFANTPPDCNMKRLKLVNKMAGVNSFHTRCGIGKQCLAVYGKRLVKVYLQYDCCVQAERGIRRLRTTSNVDFELLRQLQFVWNRNRLSTRLAPRFGVEVHFAFLDPFCTDCPRWI